MPGTQPDNARSASRENAVARVARNRPASRKPMRSTTNDDDMTSSVNGRSIAIHGAQSNAAYSSIEFDYFYLFDSHRPAAIDQPIAQLTAAGRSSLLMPGKSQAAIASLIASIAGIRVKLLRHASTTRRSGTGSSNGT